MFIFKTNSHLKKINHEDKFASFLLSDSNGSYFSQGITKNSTFYHGLITQFPENDEWTMFKFIERIEFPNKKTEIAKKGQKISFTKDNKEEVDIYFGQKELLVIDSKENTQVSINIDPRKIYDFSKFGRNIKVSNDEETKSLIVEYSKTKNPESDEIEYQLFLLLHGIKEHEFKNNWIKRNYEFDGQRRGNSEWYINEGLEISFDNRLIIVQHHDKYQAIDRLKEYLNSENNTLSDTINENTGILNEKIKDENQAIAYNNAVNSMNELSVGTQGIYAGFYWFFQFWTRDEAISLGGLIKEDKKILVKNILTRHFNNFLDDGRISNRFPHSLLGSADGIGWSVLRLAQAKDFFEKEELDIIIEKLEKETKKLEETYCRDSYFINNSKETWMDTNGDTNDVRSGIRIEIQALALNHYRVLAELTEKEEYILKEDNLRQKIRELLFDGNILADGSNQDLEVDKTQRPNIFLAYYIYPKLLNEEEWEKVFDNAINALWLNWGGFATIDKKNELFQEYYTGENDKSYHRGDSWFFVNNIAAISMKRLNEEKYKKYINKIVNAAIKDILKKGILGGISEVSSAKEQRAEGAWSQAWSTCTFIELMHELH